MAYFKWDKETGTTIVTEIKQAAADLKAITEGIDLFVQECDGKPDNLKGWEKEVKEDGGWFWKLLWDWTGDYDDFMRRLGKVQEKNNTMKSGGKVKLENLSNALAELQLLIETFDDPNAFSLRNAYEGKENVSITYNADGVEVLVYTAPDGTQYTMSEMLNAFYTYTGMSMDGQLQGYLYAQQNGVEFNAAYQSNILAGVNSTVGSINNIGGFGVASSQDILGVNSYLSQDPSYRSMLEIDANGQLVNNTGGSWYSNMEVGSSYLSTYTIADYLIDPNKAYDEGLIERPAEEVVEGGEPVPEDGVVVDGGGTSGSRAIGEEGTGGEGDATGGGGGSTGGGGGGGGMPSGRDETTENNQQESTPGDDTGGGGTDGGTNGTDTGTDTGTGDEGTIEEDFNLDEYENDTVEQFEPDFKDNYDEMARDKYESMDQDVITERRQDVINETQTMIDNNDTDGLRNKLADYGYSESDIDKIVNDPDALISAMVEGDQRQQLAEYAKDFAEQDGVNDYDTSYDDGQSYKDYQDGSSSSLTTNRSNDPEVKQAKTEYNEAREEYKEASTKVNEAANKTQESLDNVNSFKQKYGSDTSKWSKQEKADYKEAVQEYQEARNDYNQKREEYNEAKSKYDTAHENYEQAKTNFDTKIRESVQENDAQFQEERERHETVTVDVSDSDLLPGTDSGMDGGTTTDGNSAAQDQGIAINDNVEVINGGEESYSASWSETSGTADSTMEEPVVYGSEESAQPGVPPIAEGEEVLLGTTDTITNDRITGTPAPESEVAMETVEMETYPGKMAPDSEIMSTGMEEIKLYPGEAKPAEELVMASSGEAQTIPGTPAPTDELVMASSGEAQMIPGTPAPTGELTMTSAEEAIKIPGTPAPAGEDVLSASFEAQTIPGTPAPTETLISVGESSPQLISAKPAVSEVAPQVDVIQGNGESTISVNDAALLNIVSEGEMNSIRARREEE